MKKLFTLLAAAFLATGFQASAQVFWVENFDGTTSTGLIQDYTGTAGHWTLTVTGTEEANPNPWYVSCQEAGHLAGVCGSTCAASAGMGATLHVGSDATASLACIIHKPINEHLSRHMNASLEPFFLSGSTPSCFVSL